MIRGVHYKISNQNPLWINPEDAQRSKSRPGDLLKVRSSIGYLVDKVWVTEGIRPGVVACSHHLGRWRLDEQSGGVTLGNCSGGPEGNRARQMENASDTWDQTIFSSGDPDSQRIWWEDGGVHQNLIFPVQPDPVSGQHCWHQKVRLERAQANDLYGDICVDTQAAHEIYRQWLGLAQPAPGPGDLRRPLWLAQVNRPALEAFYLTDRAK